ncbi:ABC transporter permease [Bacillus sp. KH172YL63]|uniref:ABC transporter permease n=1 Tax=Bacillus sp. KH172YL63 TaxID=2709784 RepID=UPI0013E48FB1|nr:ABC transporter permease [Bacillus sp. KH172YL63]BCB05212.1 putative transport permease YfiN [Bacillus sp. KH172YL63]
MRKIISIARFEIKRLFQKRQTFLLLFGMPMLFTFIFGGAFTESGDNKPEITIVDEDQSVLSQQLITQLQANQHYSFQLTDTKSVTGQFENQDITGYIRVEKGFEKKIHEQKTPEVVFVSSPSFEGTDLVKQLIDDSLLQINITSAAGRFYQETTGEDPSTIQEDITTQLKAAPPAIETITVTKNKQLQTMNNLTGRSAGFTIMFVMIAMLSSTGVLLDARQTGVWYRMMSTPASKVELLCGYMLAFFLIGWIQFGMLMMLSKVIFHIEWGNTFANIILVSSLLLCTIGFGLFIAGFVKTAEQQSIFGNLVIISTCMLAGVYWPVEIMPDFFQDVATFLPQYWGMEGFTELTVRGGGFTDIIAPVGILLGFAVVFLIVGLRRVRFE